MPPTETVSERLNIKDLIGVDAGSRNDKLHKLACSFYARGFTDEEAIHAITEINRTYNPPLETNEVASILQSARDFISRTRSEEKANINQAFNFTSWKEFDAVDFPENPWRIDKLIPEFGITVLAAPSGGRKSWVTIEMIRSIASGIPFLGKFDTKKGNVLYIEQETPRQEIQRRGRQLRLHETDGVFLATSEEAPLNLNSDNTIQKLIEYTKSQSICAIFIDTLRSVAGGLREEKAEEIRVFFNRFKPLAEKGIAIVILDHTRKPRQFESRGKPMIDQILGSQDKIASATNVLMLGPGKESNTVTFHQMKLKGGTEHPPFVIKMRDENEDTVDKRTYLEYGGSFEEEQLKVEQMKDSIIGYLEDCGEKKKTKEIVDALGSKTNVETALQQMRADKQIGYDKKGTSYRYWFPIEAEEDIPDLSIFDEEELSLTS